MACVYRMRSLRWRYSWFIITQIQKRRDIALNFQHINLNIND